MQLDQTRMRDDLWAQKAAHQLDMSVDDIMIEVGMQCVSAAVLQQILPAWHQLPQNCCMGHFVWHTSSYI